MRRRPRCARRPQIGVSQTDQSRRPNGKSTANRPPRHLIFVGFSRQTIRTVLASARSTHAPTASRTRRCSAFGRRWPGCWAPGRCACCECSAEMPGLPPPPAPDSDEEESNRKALVVVKALPRASPSRRAPAPVASGKVAPARRDFTVQPEELCSFMERAISNKGSVEVLEREFNGIMGLAHTLRVNPALGLVRAVAADAEHPLLLCRALLRAALRAAVYALSLWSLTEGGCCCSTTDKCPGPRVSLPPLRQQHAREGAIRRGQLRSLQSR